MQGQLRRQVVAGLAAGLLCWAGAGSVGAQQNQARLSVEIPPGKFKTLRLRNAPAQAQVALAVKASSRIMVSVLDETDARTYPETREPLLTAPVEQAVSFSLTLPATGNYYVVFDNTRGTESARVQMALRAARARAPSQPAPETSPPPENADRPSPLRRQPGMHDM